PAWIVGKYAGRFQFATSLQNGRCSLPVGAAARKRLPPPACGDGARRRSGAPASCSARGKNTAAPAERHKNSPPATRPDDKALCSRFGSFIGEFPLLC